MLFVPHGIAGRADAVSRDDEEDRNSEPKVAQTDQAELTNPMHLRDLRLEVVSGVKHDDHQTGDAPPKIQAGVTRAARKCRTHCGVHKEELVHTSELSLVLSLPSRGE